MTPEELLTLLRAHQDGVYTVCLHVLRHPQDAEDAAQEALLKIASGAKDLREPRAFKTWLYRVVYRTAVDHLRLRATRRRTDEGSAAMTPAPLSDEAREAIHEAMAALPDDERLMLVEHYFEKVTIEELGRREGISDVAMGKRLEKAREKLKRGLARAGIPLGASQVSQSLESVRTASAPAGLIGSAITSKAALIAAGGMAMGTKGYSMGIVVGVAMVFLIIGAGSGYLAGARRTAARDAEPAISGTLALAGDRQVQVSEESVANGNEETRIPAAPSETPRGRANAESNSVAERLARFRKWHRDWTSEDYDRQSMIAWQEHQGKLLQQGPELREIMLKDVDALVSFMRDPENELCLADLLIAGFPSWHKQSNGFWFIGDPPLKLQDLPPALIQGLQETLSQGSETQKLAVMALTGVMAAQPERLLAEYRKLLTSSSISIVLSATNALSRGGTFTREDLDVIKQNAEFSPAVGLRQESYKAVASTGTPEALEWLFNQLLVKPDLTTTSLVAEAINQEIGLIKIIPMEVEAKAAEAVMAALGRELTEHDYDSLLRLGVNLSADSTGRILDFAARHGPSIDLKRAALKIQESFRNGERNPVRLLQRYYEAKKSP